MPQLSVSYSRRRLLGTLLAAWGSAGLLAACGAGTAATSASGATVPPTTSATTATAAQSSSSAATTASAAATNVSSAATTASSATAKASSAANTTTAAAAQAAAGSGKFNVIVDWYASGDPAEKAVWDKLIQGFKDANPNVDVAATYGLGANSEDKLTTMIVSGTAPDAVHFDRYKVGEWANKGLFVPIDAMVRDLDPGSTFLNAPLQEATFKGKLYALPTDTDIRGLFWNTALLKAAGLDAQKGPQSWDDLNNFAQKLTQQGSGPVPERVGLLPWTGNWYNYGWIWTFGGDYFDDKTFKPTINRAENVQCYGWMAQYAKQYGTPKAFTTAGYTGGDAKTFAGDEKIAMMVWHYGATVSFKKASSSFQYWGGACPHPTGGANGTWSGGLCFVVPKGYQMPDATKSWLHYFAQPDTQVTYYNESKQLPTNKAGIEKVKATAEPLEKIFLEQLDVAHWRHPYTSILAGYLNTAQNDVTALTKPPQQALDEAQQNALSQHADLWGK
jgi:multiple sugar transport system substrate-binding protein